MLSQPRQFMTRVAALIVLLIACIPAFGQDKEETKEGWLTESFRVKNVNVEKLRSLFSGLPGSLRPDRELGLLVVHAPPETMSFVQQTIAKLDIPSQQPPRPSNVEITAYLLGATRQASDDPEMISVLQPVVNKLRDGFPYQSYRLLESVVLRVRSRSRGEASGIIPDLVPGPRAIPTFYAVQADLDGVSSGEGQGMISLSEFRLSVRIPVVTSPENAPPDRVQFQYQEIGINTDLDIREGEIVVVGKAGVQGVVDGIFLVLRANVVD